MTTITIDRSLLEQALEHLDEATDYTSRTTWSPSLTQDILNFCVKLRSVLALASEFDSIIDAIGDDSAPTTEPDRHAQELLAQDITLQNMAERHAQELCAYQITVDKLKSRRKPMDREEMMDGYCRTPQFNQFVQAFEAGVLYAEYFHGIGEKP